MKRTLFLTTLILAVLAAGRAQCPDFTDLNGSGVACWTNGDVIGSSNGPIPERYAVVTQQGMDPYTGYQLPILPAGESAVVRLGNDQGGMQSEGIDYNFVVDPDYPILTIKYAFVMRNYGDISSGCPSFGIFVLQPDSEIPLMSQSIYPCGQYAFNDLQNHDEVHVTGTVIWRQWTTICIDVSNYAGQQIRVRFVTNDGMHNQSAFSYAYFTASCMSDHLTVVGCDGNDIILSAPEGYALYEWNNGATTPMTTYPIDEGLDVACTLASAHGCMPVLTSANIEGLSITQGTTYFDTICEGESYYANGFDLPQQNSPGTFTFTRTSLNPNNCQTGILYKLCLTVLQRNIHYYDNACEGAEYDQYGFHYNSLPAGSWTDSILLTTGSACTPAYKYLHLTVAPTSSEYGGLFGDTEVCDMTVNDYILNYPNPVFFYQWNLPEGVTNFTNNPGNTALLYFTEDAPNPAVISVTVTDGCGEHTRSITIHHHPAYHLSFEDTVCTGETYDAHGFQTAIFEDPGLYYLSQNGTTVSGCDSNVMVRLWVGSTPSVTTLAQPMALCTGQSAVIHAIGAGAEFEMQVGIEPDVKVGDILCTDFSIVKPENWPVPDKTAKGIVFYVDSTGQHGWAVNLHDLAGDFFNNSVCWSYGNVLISSMTYTTPRTAMSDMNGHTITQLLSQYNVQHPHLNYLGNATTIFLTADEFADGWYVPALRQLYIMFCVKSRVDESLQLVGETLYNYVDNASTKYWSSTEMSLKKAWFLDYSGTISNQFKMSGARVRLVCDF